MNEKLIERKLRESVRDLGGLALKWVSPGFTGVPDRIVLMPEARVWFPELKSTGASPSPRQRIVHDQIRALGFEVDVIDDAPGLADFLNKIKR